MAAERIPVIMNPAARGSRAARMVARVQALKPAPEVHSTLYAGHASIIAERLAREGRELVVAIGGDGTVNEVLQGVCKVNAERPDPATHCALGVLPAGTMNVFAYELGFASHRELVLPWRVMNDGNRRFIDLWQANDRYFVQLAGVGLDAEVVRHTTRLMKQRFGPFSYFLTGVKLMADEPSCLTVRTPDRPDQMGHLVLVGNGRNYGGRFGMFPKAQQTDGLLDVLIFRGQLNLRHALQVLRGVYLDGFMSSEDIDYFQFSEFTVESGQEVALQLDGELCGHTPVLFKKAPFPLRIAAA